MDKHVYFHVVPLEQLEYFLPTSSCYLGRDSSPSVGTSKGWLSTQKSLFHHVILMFQHLQCHIANPMMVLRYDPGYSKNMYKLWDKKIVCTKAKVDSLSQTYKLDKVQMMQLWWNFSTLIWGKQKHKLAGTKGFHNGVQYTAFLVASNSKRTFISL